MADPIVKRNILTSYEKTMEDAPFLIAFLQGMSAEQKSTLDKIVEFLKKYVKDAKYPEKVMDAQNYAFAKRQASDIAKIIEENVSITDKTIDKYVETAFKNIDLRELFFTQSELNAIIKDITSKFKAILDSIPNTKKEKKPNNQTSSNEESNKEKDEEKLKSILSNKSIAKLVKTQIFIPKLDFSHAFDFFNKNVFDNLRKSSYSKNFLFTSKEYLKQKKIKKTALYNKSISSIKAPFDEFEYKLTRNIIYKAKEAINKAAKRTYALINWFFPVSIFVDIVKFGFKAAKLTFNIAKKSIRFLYKTITRLASLIYNSVNFMAKSAYRIGRATVKFLYGSIKQVAKFKLLKLTVKGVLAFFRTYPGAYLLGYIIGWTYKRLHGILDFLSGVYEKAKEIFTNVKTTFETEIYDPFIKPVLEWFEKQEKVANFYVQYVSDELKNSTDGVLTTLDNVLTDFVPPEIPTKIDDITRDVENSLEFFRKLSLDDVKDFAITQGSRMFGGIVGARLGAAIGQVAIPIPVVGAVIGSLLGGFAGDWLGGKIGEMITARSKVEGVESEESPVQEYIRKNFGKGGAYQESIYGSATSNPMLSELAQLGRDIENNPDLEKSEAVKNLSARYGIDINARLASSKNRGILRDQLILFKNIDRLSYQKILSEIASSFKEMTTLMDYPYGQKLGNMIKFSPRGMLIMDDVYNYPNATWGRSEIALTKDGYRFSTLKNINPYWFKIGRDILILNKLRELMANQISPFEFVKFVDPSEYSPEEIRNLIRENNISINLSIGNKKQNIPLNDLIYGTYFKNDPDFRSSYSKTITDINKLSLAEKKDGMLKLPLGWFPLPETLIAWFPLDTDWHVFSKRLMQDISGTEILRSSASQYGASALGSNFTDIFGNIVSQARVNEEFGPAELERMDADSVANSILRRLGSGASQKFEELDVESRQALIKEAMASINSGDEFEFVGLPLERAIHDLTEQTVTNDNFENALKDALDASAGAFQSSLTIEEYSNLISGNNEFLKNKLIPALRELIKKKNLNAQQTFAIFRIPYQTTDGDYVSNDIVSPVTE